MASERTNLMKFSLGCGVHWWAFVMTLANLLVLLMENVQLIGIKKTLVRFTLLLRRRVQNMLITS